MAAANSGIRLTTADAAIIKGMIARGDRQHDIAAYFGVNGGRIGEISKGKTFASVPVQTSNLPPPGPYLTPVSMSLMRKRLRSAKAALSGNPTPADIQTALDHIDRSIGDLGAK